MKKLAMVLRILMGALFLFGSITFLLKLMPTPELQGNVKLFMEGMNATGYMLPLIKWTELFCGIAFVTGRFVPLAAIIISPVIVNIFFFHTVVDPSGFPVALFLVIANAMVGYAYWDKFRGLFAAK